MKPYSHPSSGFTAIELLVTIIVATIFTVVIYSLFTDINTSSAAARNRATASDIAYGNLRKYASAGLSPDTWSPKFQCNNSAGSSNTNDVIQNPNAVGTTLMSGTLDATVVDLPTPVTYSVRALAIFGCRAVDGNDRKPIRVESIVTFGPKNTVVKHATLVGY